MKMIVDRVMTWIKCKKSFIFMLVFEKSIQ